jgi:hypothetical protein
MELNSKNFFHGQAPLSSIAQNGHKRVVKLLRETGQVDVGEHDQCSDGSQEHS